jgi:hypothetical protein
VRVQPGGRLVEDDERGVADQCRGQQQPLLLAAGELGGAGGALVGEAQLFDEFGYRAGVGIERRPHLQRLVHLEAGEQARLLRLEGERRAQPGVGPGPEARVGARAALSLSTGGSAEHRDMAVCGRQQSGDGGDGAGLARAVTAEQSKDLAPPYGELHILYSSEVTILDGKFAHRESGGTWLFGRLRIRRVAVFLNGEHRRSIPTSGAMR